MPPSPSSASGSPGFGLPEHQLRQESARLVSMLTAILGVQYLQLAEDVVQEAMLRAFKYWPYHGVPDQPAAWLMRTAKNLALDALRREKSFRDKEPDIARALHEQLTPASDPAGEEEVVQDRLLALMFVCCHPILSEESQVALALKVVCGFGNREIARAFLVSEPAMAKRLTRARACLREADVGFVIPEGAALPPRLAGVLHTIYLLFSEGHSATDGDEVVRKELCEEALRLAMLLTAHPRTAVPETHALLALLCFHAARLPARLDPQGQIVRLEQQDRSRWDRTLIQRGMRHLALAACGDQPTSYHLEAAISACHCSAASDGQTDWPRILALYDDLLALAPSPVVMLNRSVALAKVHGPQRAMEEIQRALEGGRLTEYPHAHAVLGELELQRHRPDLAAPCFRRAIALAPSRQEQTLLAQRLRECEPHLQ